MVSHSDATAASLTADLAALRAGVDRHGDFFVSGTTELLAPALDIVGVGRVALPLAPAQAEQLLAVAEAAPFGRGAETVVDPTVRQCCQISPDRAKIGGRHWAKTLEAIIKRVGEGLAVSDPITASFYKVLIYKPGSFFVSHRDTEKTAGMFATLVIVLPGQFQGGEMRLRHGEREIRVDLRTDDPAEAAFVAFYADCVHEILPLTAGYRLALIYNLARAGRGREPKPPSYDREQMRIAELLRAWGDAPADPTWPAKLVYPLAHAYTPAELSLDALKGEDAAAAGVLREAANEADCRFSLALLTVTESGTAEYSESYGSRLWRGHSDNDFEAGEVDDRDVSLSEWRHVGPVTAMPNTLPVIYTELAPSDAMADLTPDEEYFHEATGNEGATFERTYQRAALILWPERRFHAVLCQGGLPATLPHLTDLVQSWKSAARKSQAPLKEKALDLAGHMLASWPRHHATGRDDTKSSEVSVFLAALTRLDAAEMIERFLAEIVVVTGASQADNTAIVAAMACLPPASRATLVASAITARAGAALGWCAHLFASVAAAWPNKDLIGAANLLLSALPGDPARAEPVPAWQRPRLPEPALVVDVLNGLNRIDTSLAERATDYLLAWPATYGMDAMIIPALRSLLAPRAKPPRLPPSITRLRAAAVTHLQARVAEDLTPPKDWRRANAISCRCQYCAELAKFLVDPQTRTWVMRAAEHHRSHVQTNIRQAACDLVVSTDKSGRPYGLVCVKNQASFDRRARQRSVDLDDLKKFAAPSNR